MYLCTLNCLPHVSNTTSLVAPGTEVLGVIWCCVGWWVGVRVPWCGGLVGGLGLGVVLNLCLLRCGQRASAATQKRWKTRREKGLWVLELVRMCSGLEVSGQLDHRFLGACDHGGGLPRNTENDPKVSPGEFEKCRKMLAKALILGSWPPRRRGLGTYLGRLEP